MSPNQLQKPALLLIFVGLLKPDVLRKPGRPAERV